MKRILSIAAVIAVALVPALASAQWSGPSQAPTGGNTAAPINVSGTAQEKVGGVILNSGGATNGLLIPYGRVGIGMTNPGYKLDVSGTIGATTYYYTSDRSLKTNIRPLTDALDRVTKLQGVSFAWKNGGKQSVGLVAQDVEAVYPELVNTNSETGVKSVEYGNLVAPLIEAIKEQQAQIEALKAEVEALKNQR